MTILTEIDQIKVDEGLRLRPYTCSAGKLTIGYGRNIEDRGITPAEAEYLLTNDILLVSDELREKVEGFVTFPAEVQRVLVNMTFNMGINRLLTFKRTLDLIQAGDYPEAAKEMLDSKWATQVGPRAKRLSARMANACGLPDPPSQEMSVTDRLNLIERRLRVLEER